MSSLFRGVIIRAQLATRYYSGAQLWYQQIFAPLLNFYFLYTFFLAKNTVTYFLQKPATTRKLKVSSRGDKQSQHGTIR